MLKKSVKSLLTVLAIFSFFAVVHVPEVGAYTKVITPHSHNYVGPYQIRKSGYHMISKNGTINFYDRYVCGEPKKCNYKSYLG